MLEKGVTENNRVGAPQNDLQLRRLLQARQFIFWPIEFQFLSGCLRETVRSQNPGERLNGPSRPDATFGPVGNSRRQIRYVKLIIKDRVLVLHNVYCANQSVGEFKTACGPGPRFQCRKIGWIPFA